MALCAIPCATCCLLSGAMDGGHPPAEIEVLRVGEAAPVLVELAVLLVVAVVVLSAFADRFIRQASALPPRPPPDPLASYRDGNGVRECPAHPFAPPE